MPECVVDIEGVCREKVMVWSNEMGEIWFHPNPRVHVSNARAVAEPYGSTGRIAMVLAYGDDQYLDADGRMPPEVIPPEPKRDPAQEEEDPLGEWTTPSSVLNGDVITFEVVALRKPIYGAKQTMVSGSACMPECEC